MRLGGAAVGIFLSLVTLSCTERSTFRTSDYQTVKVEELPADFKIPAKIWELIEADPDEKKSNEESNRGIFYSAIKVFLTEKNHHILKSPAYVVEFPRGGGTLDLAQYLTGDLGSFFVGFELPEEFEEGKNLRVFYVSKGRKRKLDDRVYGSGCTQYLDLTKKFLEMMKTEGIKANSTRERHVTLLAGHYIFSTIKDSRVFLTQVSITDSRYKNLICEEL